jgi:hypothetical protein
MQLPEEQQGIRQGEEQRLLWQVCSVYFAAIVAVTYLVSITGADGIAWAYSPCSPIWRLSAISRKGTHVTK